MSSRHHMREKEIKANKKSNKFKIFHSLTIHRLSIDTTAFIIILSSKKYDFTSFIKNMLVILRYLAKSFTKLVYNFLLLMIPTSQECKRFITQVKFKVKKYAFFSFQVIKWIIRVRKLYCSSSNSTSSGSSNNSGINY